MTDIKKKESIEDFYEVNRQSHDHLSYIQETSKKKGLIENRILKSELNIIMIQCVGQERRGFCL